MVAGRLEHHGLEAPDRVLMGEEVIAHLSWIHDRAIGVWQDHPANVVTATWAA
jgi:hypothetical protein